MNLIPVTLHQSNFFCSTPTLNLLFTIKSIRDMIKILRIDQFYRQSFLCMISPQPILMLPQTTRQILCTSRIEGAIGTFQNIHIGHYYDLVQKNGLRLRSVLISSWLSGVETSTLTGFPQYQPKSLHSPLPLPRSEPIYFYTCS